MQENIYIAVTRAGESFDLGSSTIQHGGCLSYGKLAPHYKSNDNISVDSVDYISTVFTAKRKTSREGTDIVLSFTETKLGDALYIVRFCGQIKFSGIKAADAPDLQDWAEKVLYATKTFAVAITKFMNTDI